MVGREGLSDEQWQCIEPMLPRSVGRGRPWEDHRRIVDGIFWILRTGVPWRDLPERFGPWQTVYERFNRWRREGLWKRLVEQLQGRMDAQGLLDWALWCIDSSSIRASRAAAGAHPGQGGEQEPADHALGRSRGGYGTKLHLICDSHGTALSAELSPGQAHESRYVEAVLDNVPVAKKGRRGCRRPRQLAGDKAYSYRRVRRGLLARRVEPVIPEHLDQKRQRKGRPPTFDRQAYRRRNVVERCIGWLKEMRRIATRYEKLAVNYLAMVHIAMIGMYLAA